MQQYYDKEQAKKGSYLAVEFEVQNIKDEEKRIELDMPVPKGVIHNDWKIYPLVPPIVSNI